MYTYTPLRSEKPVVVYKYQLNSLDFTINRFFMKLFRTTDMRTIVILQEMFSFALRSDRSAYREIY